jgi:glycosyltransferase involved in cell wall biosynthesis
MSGVVVHEWVERHGGAERVVDAMLDMHPDADLHCLWNDAPERYAHRRVTESWIARSPLRGRKSLALPLMPAAWAGTDLSAYDWALVSSHLFAHHVAAGTSRVPDRFVYVHSPARYIWEPELDQRGQHPVARALAPAFQRIDRRRAAQGAQFAANSDFVRRRIQRTWEQDAAVIFPPVRVEELRTVAHWRDELEDDDARVLDELPSTFLLGASRFVGYKRLDVVIQAGEAAELPVVIAGSGPGLAELQELASAASVPVHVVSRPSDALLYALYQQACAYVFPAIEDFGIMPVESMALGTPVIVFSEGGARESVELLGGGVVIEEFTPGALRQAVHDAAAIDMDTAGAAAAEQFGVPAFQRRIDEWMRGSSPPPPVAGGTSSGAVASPAA